MLDAVIGGAIITIGAVGAMALFNASAKRARHVASSVAVFPLKEAILSETLAVVAASFRKAAENVANSPMNMSCPTDSCFATFAGTLPVEYVNFPWLDLKDRNKKTPDAPGPFLSQLVPGVATTSVGVVPSKVLSQNAGPSHKRVDAAYCKATVAFDTKGNPSSHVFRLQTHGRKPGDREWPQFMQFFGNLYRPIQTSAASTSQAAFSPRAGTLLLTAGGQTLSAKTTYRFAIRNKEVIPVIFNGGDSWLTQRGAVVTLPAHLGFYWRDGSRCIERPPTAESCNQTATPFTFNLNIGDMAAQRLTPANAPEYPANSAASALIQRCAQQSIDKQNFGLDDKIRFCLRYDGTAIGNQGVTGLIGEFEFRVRSYDKGTTMSCGAVGSKLRQGNKNYFAELSYTLVWRDTVPNPASPKGFHMVSGVEVRQEWLQ
jgi:hypothetical protein